jgi:Holliday junction resolvasome RuvABC endonuclease subunit
VRTCGVDIGSSNYKAIALAVNGVPIRAAVWKPPEKRDSKPAVLEQSFEWFYRWLNIFKPDVVSVEQLPVFMNKKVIRTLSHHEGVALLAAKRSGAIVLNPTPSQSRAVVFHNGRLSKDDAWVAFKKMYPDFKLLAKNSGGSDQMDAMTHALAAPTVLERR